MLTPRVPRNLEPPRNPFRDGQIVEVEIGNASFHRACHRHLVGTEKEIVRKRNAGIHIEQAVNRIETLRAAQPPPPPGPPGLRSSLSPAGEREPPLPPPTRGPR